MTCYATNGGVSRADMSADPAWIAITEEEYDQAVVAMTEGRIVSISDGFALLSPNAGAEPGGEELQPHYPIYIGNAKLDLFTPAEQLAVVTATMSVPEIKLMYDRLINAAYLTYEDPEMERGLQLLLDKGLLTAERKAEIVAAMQPA